MNKREKKTMKELGEDVQKLTLLLSGLRTEFDQGECEHEPMITSHAFIGCAPHFFLVCSKCNKELKSYLTPEEHLIFLAEEGTRKADLAASKASKAIDNLQKFLEDNKKIK